MNSIKAFFKRKEAEAKFREAGPGHKLSDDSSSSQQPQQSVIKTQPQRSVIKTQPQRNQPTDVARRAGEAALARIEQNQNAPVNWSLAAVRAQARKELELEVQAAEKSKHAQKEVFKESCQLLSVSGVYFTCPLIGSYVLTRSEIEAKIKEFLYSQLSEEPGLTACLIIHSCNRDKEKVRLGIETLTRYLTNIMDNPTEEKYRKIRINNKIFQDRIASLEGTYDFFLAAGFNKQALKHGEGEEDHFVFPEDRLADIETLQILKEALLSAEPVRPILDRNAKVLMPSQVTQTINLPNDFFTLSADELLKEQEEKAQAVEINSRLRTKAMRERDCIREMRFYRYTLIRVRFPDGIILQGTFNVRERLKSVKEFITENLANPNREFTLLAPGGFKLHEMDGTLMELKLVPAVILNLHWSIEDDRRSGEDEVAYLRAETMSLLQNA